MTAGTSVVLPYAGILTAVIAGACACSLYGSDGTGLWLTVMTPGAARADVRGHCTWPGCPGPRRRPGPAGSGWSCASAAGRLPGWSGSRSASCRCWPTRLANRVLGRAGLDSALPFGPGGGQAGAGGRQVQGGPARMGYHRLAGRQSQTISPDRSTGTETGST